jgi:hypothetical protein
VNKEVEIFYKFINFIFMLADRIRFRCVFIGTTIDNFYDHFMFTATTYSGFVVSLKYFIIPKKNKIIKVKNVKCVKKESKRFGQ